MTLLRIFRKKIENIAFLYQTPLMLRGVFLIIILSLFSSGGWTIENDLLSPLQKYKKYVKQDYVDQLCHVRENYLKSAKLVKLKKFQKQYLTSLYQKIRKDNKNFFPVKLKPEFYVVKDETPFYFSFPHNSYIFSSGLIKKYFKNEITLRAALTFMMLQCHNLIYIKNILVPIGYYSTDLLLSLVRIPVPLKGKVDQAAYWVFRNNGISGEYYLLWIQLQNRNTLDFSRQIGDPQFITREEYLFKQFISKRSDSSLYKKSVERNSSIGFYRFTRNI